MDDERLRRLERAENRLDARVDDGLDVQHPRVAESDPGVCALSEER